MIPITVPITLSKARRLSKVKLSNRIDELDRIRLDHLKAGTKVPDERKFEAEHDVLTQAWSEREKHR